MTEQPTNRLWLRRVSAIAHNTLLELTRLRVFHGLLIFALLLIASSLFFARLTFQQEFQILKDVSLGAISIFTSLLAILATARMLPQEIEDRTVYTILAKPVPRFEYLLGKLAGVLLLLVLSTVALAGVFCALLYFREQSAVAETTRQLAAMAPAELEAQLNAIRASAFTANLWPALGAIYLKACVLAAITLFISTFATSTIFTTVVALFVYFIGHLQATAREFWLEGHGGGWMTRIFLAVVAIVFPDLELFNLSDSVVTGASVPVSHFLETAAFGCFYVVLYWLCATAVFAGREL